MERTERPLSPKETARVLDLGDSTLRKWCIAIEKEGYYFSRTENKRRVFYDDERLMLHQFKHLVQVQHLSIENAAKIVASKAQDNASSQQNSDSTDITVRDYNEQMQKLVTFIDEQTKHIALQEEYIRRQEAFNARLLERLEEQDRRNEERLKERDNQLMNTLEEMRRNNAEKKNKSIWSRLFTGD